MKNRVWVTAVIVAAGLSFPALAAAQQNSEERRYRAEAQNDSQKLRAGVNSCLAKFNSTLRDRGFSDKHVGVYCGCYAAAEFTYNLIQSRGGANSGQANVVATECTGEFLATDAEKIK